MEKPKIVAHSIRFGADLDRRLTEVVNSNHVTRSAIINDAVRAWLNRKGDDELELRFATRLDRMSKQLGKIDYVGRVGVESLALFVRYMLTIHAPLPEGDDAARAIGRDRFAAFVERVGRQLASGKSSLVPDNYEK